MLFLTRRPAPPLDAAIERLWYCRAPQRPFGLERVLPNGGPQLIVNLAQDETRTYHGADLGERRTMSGTILGGVATQSLVIDTREQEHVLGVSFRPGGTRAFAVEPASVLVDLDVPLDTLWGRSDVQRLRDEALSAATPEAALDALEAALGRRWTDRQVHPAVLFALRAFGRRPTVARVGDVTAAVGLSPKRFIDRFALDVGVTPKRYCRLLRFRHAVSRAHASARVDWSAVAADGGYSDQAHLIHDFRAFSGLTPTQYEAARTAFPNHVTFLQSPPA